MTSGWKRWIHIAWLLSIPYSGNAVTPTIAAGQTGSMFLNSDGTLCGTVNNSKGQLGDGTTQDRSQPQQVANPPEEE